MIDLYLKADTADEMNVALEAAGLIDAEGQPAREVDIDHIGAISRVTGYDDNGDPIVQRHPGHHTNVRTGFEVKGEAFNAIASLIVEPPATPFRVWG